MNETTQVDEIEFVIRNEQGDYAVTVPGTTGFSYTTSIDAAQRWLSANAAATRIRQRQQSHGRLGGRFVIVPVKVTSVPATTKVELY